MNHCVLEVDVLQAPTLRYTQDNQTPIAEMEVGFDALRPDDPRGQLKVVGWGNLAQDQSSGTVPGMRAEAAATPAPTPAKEPAAQWNTAPLVPDTDDIPF